MSATTLEATLPIAVRNVTTGYGSRTVIEDISIEVQPGEFLAIVGPNGGGKTTLLRAILGLLPVWRGEIRVFGETPQRGRNELGYVPQGIEFDPSFPIRVRDVVRMGRLGKRGLLQWYGRADREAADWALERVGLASLYRRPIGELSGGQRQRDPSCGRVHLPPHSHGHQSPDPSCDPAVASESRDQSLG